MGYGGKTAAGSSTDYNDEPPDHPVPLVDENLPGLGRHGGTLAEQRRQSGDLPDASADEPVRSDSPFRPRR